MLTQTGVLNKRDLRHLIHEGIISGPSIERLEDMLDSTTIDHSLGERGYYLGRSILPGNKTMTQVIQDRKKYELNGDRFYLHKRQVYLFPLAEKLKLYDQLSGESSSKSSIGRLGIVTRLITERGEVFNEIPAGYQGSLYLEVYSLVFDLELKPGLSLNQTRFNYGPSSFLPEHLVKASHQGSGLLFANGGRCEGVKTKGSGVLMTADLETGGILAARETDKQLDLTKDFKDSNNLYRTEDFFERRTPDERGELVLWPGEFYNILAREGSLVPLDCAAEVRKFDKNVGEINTEEASYVHGGWGTNRSDEVVGTPLILEVTANKFPFTIVHGSPLAFLDYLKLTSSLTREEAYGGVHNYQGLTAGKIFKD
ncbi:MAG: 2'-deoxycytidine 5'-triphosphate deaminase [Candidatus Nanoarchaeia archaeon]|jgi:dCTP deaminase|nr:2'-deoxycytidine 5'-triphosphate deaminase [Candidatus Nanoarchaeia archaeon]|tara:strand:+ start:1498 stop:2604 length:1107 start_codon:yes stop_codon:yes gene_type:complete